MVDHEDADPWYLGELRPQIGHDLFERARALGPRFEVDVEAGLIQGAAASTTAADTDAAAETGDVRILSDDIGDFVPVSDHFVEADALDALNGHLKAPLVLTR